MKIPRFQFRFIPILCLLFFGINFWWEAKREPEKLKNDFLSSLEKQISSIEQEYLDGIEFQLRLGSLPFYPRETAKRILERNRFTSVKIYDDTFRLLSSIPPSQEVFLSELRHSPQLLKPGETSILGSGETIYRTLNGDTFISYIKPLQASPTLYNPNLEFGFLYWTFDPLTGQIIYTNDSTVLSGDSEPQKLLATFLQTESNQALLSYRGISGKLIKTRKSEQEVFLLVGSKDILYGALSDSFLRTALLFTFLIFWSLKQSKDRIQTIQITPKETQQILAYVSLILLYSYSSNFLPEERFYPTWGKFRFGEIHSLLAVLEKEIINEGTKLSLSENSSIGLTHSILRDIEVASFPWQNQPLSAWSGGNTPSFSTIASSESPRIFPIENHSVFLVPLPNEKRTIILARLSSETLYSAKEKNKDEYYFLKYSIGKTENRKSLRAKKFTTSEQTSSGFQSYEINSPRTIAVYMKGLTLWKGQGKLQILPTWAYSFTIPLLGLSFFQWFSKRQIQKKQKTEETEVFLPEIIAIAEEPNQLETISQESSESRGEMGESELSAVDREQKKDAEGLPEPSNLEPMKLSKPEFFPPSSWKKFHSQAEIQKKRESIFTPELKNLVQSVSKSKLQSKEKISKQETLKKPSNDQSSSNIPSLPEMERRWLDAVYTKSEVSSEGLLDYLKIKIGNIGSRFSLLSLNTQLGSYTNSFSSGLDYSTKSNLIFLFNDPFFQFDSEGFFELVLTDEWRRNVFLAKKFSWEILSQSEILLAYDLNSLGFEGLLILLLDKREVALWKVERRKKLQAYMRELIPALHKVARGEWEESEVYGDSLTWQIRSFIHATMGGQRALFVTRVIWENFISEPENEVKKLKIFQNLSQLLMQHDAILETSSNSFLLLSERDIKAEIILQLKTFPFPYDIKFMHYPTDGENYFLYF